MFGMSLKTIAIHAAIAVAAVAFVKRVPAINKFVGL
jgi:hypothetical protein